MNLNHRIIGQGEPIIILHGLFGTMDNWVSHANALAEDYMVCLLDQRNHGKSPHVEGLSYPILAEDLRQFMEDNWIYSAHIIGHSMGGKVAMQFALQHPEMVKKLIIVDIAPEQYEGGHEDIFKALFSVDLAKVKTRKEVEIDLTFKIRDTATRQFLLKNLSINTETQKYEWKMNLPEIAKNYERILANISYQKGDMFRGDTLFIRGELSKYVQPHRFRLFKEWFPNAELATVQGAAHWVHAEQPEAFLTTVKTFLEK